MTDKAPMTRDELLAMASELRTLADEAELMAMEAGRLADKLNALAIPAPMAGNR